MNRSDNQLTGYQWRQGIQDDRSLLVKFLKFSYEEQYPHQDFEHLEQTVNLYFSHDTPLWWVAKTENGQLRKDEDYIPEVGVLWLGQAVDQITGKNQTYILLLYVVPEHRRKGIGSALMNHAQEWAKYNGDSQVVLQVFSKNRGAITFYQELGYNINVLSMVKSVKDEG